MIGRIAGRLIHRGEGHVVIDAGGVGYVVQVSDRTLAALPGPGEAAALWTELLVREDALTLVGFPMVYEKDWHRMLMTVQGVGAKAAMAILGTLGAEGVARALALGDWSAIKAAPGIGPKTAQRLVMELKDKAPGLMAGAGREGLVAGQSDAVIEAAAPRRAAPAAAPRPAPAASAEALSALTNLGYGPGEAAAAVAEAQHAAPEALTPALIRAALKLLAPKG
jgi:Holliday junction DNA helicase RuvA